jgi:hypothetical protein
MTEGIALHTKSNDTNREYGEAPLEFETPNPDPQSRYPEMLLTHRPNKHVQIISLPIANLKLGIEMPRSNPVPLVPREDICFSLELWP